jgi:hypothetical protein
MAGAGNIPPQVVPEAMGAGWEWTKARQLQIDVDEVPLKKIAEAWQQKTEGKRIVIVPQV